MSILQGITSTAGPHGLWTLSAAVRGFPMDPLLGASRARTSSYRPHNCPFGRILFSSPGSKKEMPMYPQLGIMIHEMLGYAKWARVFSEIH